MRFDQKRTLMFFVNMIRLTVTSQQTAAFAQLCDSVPVLNVKMLQSMCFSVSDTFKECNNPQVAPYSLNFKSFFFHHHQKYFRCLLLLTPFYDTHTEIPELWIYNMSMHWSSI